MQSKLSACMFLQHVKQEASRGGLPSDQDELTAVSLHNGADLARNAGPSRPSTQVGMHTHHCSGHTLAAAARTHTLMRKSILSS